MFSLCIPTMNRYDNFLNKNLQKYIENIFINEIIICDENGNDIKKIELNFPNNDKLKLYKNDQQLGPFLNKINACNKAKNEWIALIDSDNFADIDYFQIVSDYIKNYIHNEKNIILAPSFAKPNFNYTYLSGKIFKKGEFKNLKEFEKIHRNNLTSSIVLMNTGNYIINKYLINNLDLTNEKNNIKYSSACDVIYFNTLLFEQLNLYLHVIKDLTYEHVIHNDSIYTKTCNNFKEFNENIHKRYNELN